MNSISGNRILVLWARLSAICFCWCIILFVYSWITNSKSEDLACRFSFNGHFTIAIIGRYGESMIIFNQRKPYLGSLYTVSDGTPIHVTRLDGSGIYFRSIADPAFTTKWWTFMVSLWYPIAAFGTISLLLFSQKLKKRKANTMTLTC